MNSNFGKNATEMMENHGKTLGNMFIIAAVQAALFVLTIGFLIVGLVTSTPGAYLASAIFAGSFCIGLIVAAVIMRQAVAKTTSRMGHLFDNEGEDGF